VRYRCNLCLALTLGLSAAQVVCAQQVTGATFGNVIQLAAGTPSDIVLDEPRHLLYLVSNTTNQVNIFDYTSNQVIGAISVGSGPLAGAMSMDGSTLYVTSAGTSSLNVIDLNARRVSQTVVLPAAPQGVEVGVDGRALVSLSGTIVAGVPQNTLSIFDPTQSGSAQLQAVAVPALPSTPAPIPAPVLGRPITTFASKLLRTPDGNFIVGVITPTTGSTYLFVYEVASGIVLRNRTVAGASSVLSMAPDGSKFMSGLSLFDITTLQVIAAENNANAPFPFTSALNTQQNVGGSIFAPDGSAIYAAFNTAPVANPPVSAQSSTMLVNDPANLAIRLGIKLPESIVAKIVMKKDGSEAWGLSDSGMIHLPLGSLYTYPILMPETNTVFLSMDDCNRGIASAILNVNNAGQGKLTYTVTSTNNAALIYQQSSGLAPSTITFTMEPGRTGITRQAGTNIWSGGTGVAAVSGTPFTVTLASPEAINLPTSIRVYMNYRQPDQRGVVFPVPTLPNINSSGTNTGQTATGNEGLQDLLLDEARGRLYITNSALNRIEVFDTHAQQFLNPIPVGQMPHQMAMGSDGNTLYVGNTGGESISVVDLNLAQVVNTVVFPAIPRNGTTAVIYPRSLSVGLFGPQFVMSNGTSWEVVNSTAIPRPASTIIPVTMAGGPNYGMIATAADDFILTLSGDGHAYVYNGTNDAYVSTRFLNSSTTAAIQGYYGPLAAGPGGAYYLVDGLILNSSLIPIGGSFVPSTAGAIVPTRNVAAVAPLDANTFLRLTTPIRASITTTTTDDPRTTLELVNIANGTDNLIGVVPEQPLVTVLGTTRYNTTARNMVVDGAGTTAYALTISGLSVISLAPTSSATQPAINPGATGIVNAVDGTTNIQPGSFININGQNLASPAKALTVPPPTVLGGSCVTFGDIAAPLLVTSSGQIQAQVPATILPGTQIVEVRSLATAQDSTPVAITVHPPGSTTVKPPTTEPPTPNTTGRPGRSK
jgi:DNA-binding beta-propeller fold protein YncE